MVVRLPPPGRPALRGPLADGVVSCVWLAGRRHRDLLGRSMSDGSTILRGSAGKLGMGYRFSSANHRAVLDSMPQLDQWTLVYLVDWLGTGGSGFGRWSCTATQTHCVVSNNNNTSQIGLIINTTATTAVTVGTLGGLHLLILRTVPGSTTDTELFLDGASKGTQSWSSTSVAAQEWTVGNRPTNSRQFDGWMYHMTVYGRSLSDQEVGALAADPWAHVRDDEVVTLGAGEAGEPPAEPTNELLMLVA